MDNFDISIDDYKTETRTRTRRDPSDDRDSAPRRPQNGKRPAKRKEQAVKSTPFYRDKRFRLGFGVFLVVVAFVMLLSAISHLKNGAIDQSVVAGRTVTEVADSGEQVKNVGGALGAWISDALMTRGLGLGAFVLVFWLGAIGLSMLHKSIKIKFWSFSFKCIFTALAASVIAGLLMFDSPSLFHWGGVHGRYVNIELEHLGGPLLSYAVTVILAGCLVAIYLNALTTGWRKLKPMLPKRKATIADADEGPALSDIGDDLPLIARRSDMVASMKTVSTDEVRNTPSDNNGRKNLDQAFGLDHDADNDAADSETAKNDTAVKDAAGNSATVAVDADFSVKTTEVEQGNDTIDHVSADAEYDHRAELSRYVFPSIDLLTERPEAKAFDMEEQQQNKDLIIKTLRNYKVEIQRIEATVGPTVTLYEVVPADGVRIAQIERLEDDIARSLSAIGIRIIAPIPGRGTVGIEVPNRDPQIVSIRTILSSKKYQDKIKEMRLPVAMGTTISNEVFISDLAKMPHLLVAGATGQGKSVGLNCIIASLLYAKHPSELKFVLIDPKKVEFSIFRPLECHYLAKLPDQENPIITDPDDAARTLASLCVEMEARYTLLETAMVRSIEEYNAKFSRHQLNPEHGHKYMQYIVVIVDEFADLVMMAGKEISFPIARLAQKARAVGMHVIIATQRPSTDVITGVIKANFPARIAFKTSQAVDSKTILDRTGAHQLIGRGDMLVLENGKITRVQCGLIDTPEVEAIVNHVNSQIGFETAYLLPEAPNDAAGADLPDMSDPSQRDPLFAQCARFIVTQSSASTSSLQRRFSIGYNKAGKIMDQLEAAGIVGPAQGAKPRQVLVDPISVESYL